MKQRIKALSVIPGVLVFLFFTHAVSYADLLYVANNGNNTVDVINSSGQPSVFASNGLSGPAGLAFDSSGNLYVGNFNNNTVEKFDSAGNGTLFANTLMDGPGGMVFDTNGNLYVASLNGSGPSITKFDSSGTGTDFADVGQTPYGLAIDTNNLVYLSKFNGQQIVKFDQFGGGSTFASVSTANGLTGPTGMAFDKFGNLYVSVVGDSDLGSTIFTNGAILKIDSSGNGTVFASNLNFPIGLAFDSSGTLYAAIEGDNTIEKFDSNGNGTVFASGLDDPVFIAFQVPEPSTWILVVLGVGALLRIHSLLSNGHR
jgi:sugar lactone lactonase YvrE